MTDILAARHAERLLRYVESEIAELQALAKMLRDYDSQPATPVIEAEPRQTPGVRPTLTVAQQFAVNNLAGMHPNFVSAAKLADMCRVSLYALRAYITDIRKAEGFDVIETEKGKGYRLSDEYYARHFKVPHTPSITASANGAGWEARASRSLV